MTKKKPAAKTAKKKTPEKSSAGETSLGTVRALAKIIDEYGLSRIMVDRDGVCLELERGGVVAQPAMAQVAVAPAPAPSAAGEGDSHGKNGAATEADVDSVTIHSPFVGTFYSSPGPEAPAFVEVGQRIKKGQVLCIVEAMKLMNEIEAEVEGTIVSVLVTNDQTVEYNQPLFKLDPA